MGRRGYLLFRSYRSLQQSIYCFDRRRREQRGNKNAFLLWLVGAKALKKKDKKNKVLFKWVWFVNNGTFTNLVDLSGRIPLDGGL